MRWEENIGKKLCPQHHTILSSSMLASRTINHLFYLCVYKYRYSSVRQNELRILLIAIQKNI